MKNRLILLVIILLSANIAYTQNYPQGYFIAPLDPPLKLTGTFAEIRDNHFHSGLDLSTDEEEGLPVMAAAEGYISRIKISPEGYGKALYVTHPNGYVTVYGHLQKFTANINSYIRRLQYERQVYELDINPKVNEYIVKQRDVIAYSGNTGGSEGPHVHFEIRDEKSEEPINPLLFGIYVKDNWKPVIQEVRIFPYREAGIVNTTDSAISFPVVFENNRYRLERQANPMVIGKIGFGITAFDYQDSIEAELGIYKTELYVDGKLEFSSLTDRFNFDDTRYANARIDYSLKKFEGIKSIRLHKLPGDKFGPTDPSRTGWMDFSENGGHEIRIVVYDYSGNSSEINFSITAYESLRGKSYRMRPLSSNYVTFDKGISLNKSKIEIQIRDSSFYEDFYFIEAESPSTYLSDIFTIGDEHQPLHHPMFISIKPNSVIPDSLKLKAVVIRIDQFGDKTSCGGLWKGDFLSAKSNQFGHFAVTVDTFPPKVEKYYVPADMNTMYGGVVQIRVKDDLSSIRNYSGKINGKWHLFEYDKKNDMLIANVESMDVNETHPIEITVSDENGNTTVWTSTFYY